MRWSIKSSSALGSEWDLMLWSIQCSRRVDRSSTMEGSGMGPDALERRLLQSVQCSSAVEGTRIGPDALEHSALQSVEFSSAAGLQIFVNIESNILKSIQPFVGNPVMAEQSCGFTSSSSGGSTKLLMSQLMLGITHNLLGITYAACSNALKPPIYIVKTHDCVSRATSNLCNGQ